MNEKENPCEKAWDRNQEDEPIHKKTAQHSSYTCLFSRILPPLSNQATDGLFNWLNTGSRLLEIENPRELLR